MNFLIYIQDIYRLLGNEKNKLPFIIVVFLISSLLDAIGIGLIGPYVSFLLNPSLIDSTLADFLPQQMLNLDKTSMLILISIGLVLIFLSKALIGIFVLWVITSFSYKQQVILRSKLMQSFQSMLYLDYTKRNTSEYIYAVNNLAGTYTSKILTAGLKMISDILIVVGIIVILALTDISILVILITLLLSVMWLFDNFVKDKIQAYGKKTNEAADKLIKGVIEGINGMKEVRILGKQGYFYDKVHASAEEFAVNNKMMDIYAAIPRYMTEFVVIFFLTIVVIVQLKFSQDFLSFIPLVAVYGFASLRLIPAVNSIVTGFMHLRFNKHTISLLKKDIEGSNYRNRKRAKSTHNNFESIKLKNVSFSYPNKSEKTINDVSMKFMKGEYIGIVGSSGSGKTTLINLLTGLLSPSSGIIEYNNQDIKENLQDWQDNIAYLPQEIFLIDDTVEKNIALGVIDEMIDSDLLYGALEVSNLLEYTNSLPDGIHTMIGEGGISLSGGQRQRLALARAIYHKRNVLILDEATSSLDTGTERKVIEAMDALKSELTIIVIAHRYNTLESCDRIYKIDNGVVTKNFTYEELTEEDISQKTKE
jgi:ATP-binding cassette, subfamily B, bacterial PglK